MTKVFISMTMSVDGYVAPIARPGDYVGDTQWMKQWSRLQAWVFPQSFFRKNLKFGDGGKIGYDNQLLEDTFNRTGVSIMGKHMFNGGAAHWPEEAPFHTPVFVLTHEKREPWVRPGGTTFYFVNDGIESALRQAREVAGGRDIRIAGGANLAGQYLNAGLVDELHIALSPIFMGSGLRLFENLDGDKVQLEIMEAVTSPEVTQLRYKVINH